MVIEDVYKRQGEGIAKLIAFLIGAPGKGDFPFRGGRGDPGGIEPIQGQGELVDGAVHHSAQRGPVFAAAKGQDLRKIIGKLIEILQVFFDAEKGGVQKQEGLPGEAHEKAVPENAVFLIEVLQHGVGSRHVLDVYKRQE